MPTTQPSRGRHRDDGIDPFIPTTDYQKATRASNTGRGRAISSSQSRASTSSRRSDRTNEHDVDLRDDVGSVSTTHRHEERSLSKHSTRSGRSSIEDGKIPPISRHSLSTQQRLISYGDSIALKSSSEPYSTEILRTCLNATSKVKAVKKSGDTVPFTSQSAGFSVQSSNSSDDYTEPPEITSIPTDEIVDSFTRPVDAALESIIEDNDIVNPVEHTIMRGSRDQYQLSRVQARASKRLELLQSLNVEEEVSYRVNTRASRIQHIRSLLRPLDTEELQDRPVFDSVSKSSNKSTQNDRAIAIDADELTTKANLDSKFSSLKDSGTSLSINSHKNAGTLKKEESKLASPIISPFNTSLANTESAAQSFCRTACSIGVSKMGAPIDDVSTISNVRSVLVPPIIEPLQGDEDQLGINSPSNKSSLSLMGVSTNGITIDELPGSGHVKILNLEPDMKESSDRHCLAADLGIHGNTKTASSMIGSESGISSEGVIGIDNIQNNDLAQEQKELENDEDSLRVDSISNMGTSSDNADRSTTEADYLLKSVVSDSGVSSNEVTGIDIVQNQDSAPDTKHESVEDCHVTDLINSPMEISTNTADLPKCDADYLLNKTNETDHITNAVSIPSNNSINDFDAITNYIKSQKLPSLTSHVGSSTNKRSENSECVRQSSSRVSSLISTSKSGVSGDELSEYRMKLFTRMLRLLNDVENPEMYSISSSYEYSIAELKLIQKRTDEEMSRLLGECESSHGQNAATAKKMSVLKPESMREENSPRSEGRKNPPPDKIMYPEVIAQKLSDITSHTCPEASGVYLDISSNNCHIVVNNNEEETVDQRSNPPRLPSPRKRRVAAPTLLSSNSPNTNCRENLPSVQEVPDANRAESPNDSGDAPAKQFHLSLKSEDMFFESVPQTMESSVDEKGLVKHDDDEMDSDVFEENVDKNEVTEVVEILEVIITATSHEAETSIPSYDGVGHVEPSSISTTSSQSRAKNEVTEVEEISDVIITATSHEAETSIPSYNGVGHVGPSNISTTSSQSRAKHNILFQSRVAARRTVKLEREQAENHFHDEIMKAVSAAEEMQRLDDELIDEVYESFSVISLHNEPGSIEIDSDCNNVIQDQTSPTVIEDPEVSSASEHNILLEENATIQAYPTHEPCGCAMQ